MRNNTIISHFFWIWILIPIVSVGKTLDPPFNTKTPILGITAVDDDRSDVVEKESAPGGAAEMIRFFSTQLHLELASCGQSIANIFDRWLTDHKMIPIKKESRPEHYFMRVWDIEKRGIFEAGYLVSKEPKYVRVSLDFYDISGSHLPLQDINNKIEKYKISTLWKSLEDALECGI